jgi:uncharacterized protein (TIGR02246 family)
MRSSTLVAVLTAIGTAISLPGLAQDKATVQQLENQWAEAFNKGDIASVVAMYTEDAYVLPPGGEMVKGRSAIQAFWTAASKDIGDIKLTTVDVMPLGTDAAREIGTVTARTKEQQPEEITGKYVLVLRKVGSDWKIATDIWNENK